jgi:hypothetical protein
MTRVFSTRHDGGGRACERTEKQFRQLFAASGWQPSRIIRTAATDSIVEGVPA